MSPETEGRRDKQMVLSDAQRLDWLQIIRSDNVGPVTFRRLLNRFGSASGALAALPRLGATDGRNGPIKIASREKVAAEFEAIQQIGARLVAMGETGYPGYLNHIAGAPPLVTIKGGEGLDWRRTVALVGSRNASAAGQRMARVLASDLGEAGYTTVSGLARGIDTAVHRASLTTGTIAVLAGGLDRIYPSENVPLADDILANGGALISEMPMGWEPRARDFPRRNRLVSGLSLGVVVVEAAKRSGSLITARTALEQNREVFAVPGSPLDARAEGANAIIQQGAALVCSANDIVDVLVAADPTRLPLFEDETEPFYYTEGRDGLDQGPPSAAVKDRLMNALSVTPVSIDELVESCGIEARTVLAVLLDLELADMVHWHTNQQVGLKV